MTYEEARAAYEQYLDLLSRLNAARLAWDLTDRQCSADVSDKKTTKWEAWLKRKEAEGRYVELQCLLEEIDVVALRVSYRKAAREAGQPAPDITM